MAQPKKQTSRSKTGHRRSHLLGQLTRAVNKNSPVKVYSHRQRRQLKKMAPITPRAGKKSKK